jgi:PhnB protein
MGVKKIPEGYHTATPYLIIKGAAQAIEFYKKAFGATEIMRLAMPDGTIMHAEIRIGDSAIMLSEPCPQMGYKGPIELGGTPVSLYLYVDNVDEQFAQAVAAGATVTKPLADQFYGDRSGTLTDPFGHVWSLGTHIEDVSVEEIERRAAEFMKKAG